MSYNNPAIEEISGIFSGWRVWFILSWSDIKLRYRRSSLGPFWITLSTAIRIYFMGFLYAHLFKLDLATYFPFLASGIISWVTIATLLNESAFAFIESENYLRNIKILYSHLIMRVILKNIIIFAHNILAYIPIILYYGNFDAEFNLLNILLLVPNIMILIANGFVWGSIIAILGTRFRDLSLIVDSIVQVIFFMTPIMWMPSLLPDKYLWTVLCNPFYHIVSLIRDPLLGHCATLFSYQAMAIITFIGLVLFYYLMNRTKYRIIFWL